MKYYIALFSLIFSASSLQAQKQIELLSDSIKSKQQRVAKAITNQFPTTRFLDVQYEQLSNGGYDSDLYERDYESGDLKGRKRLKVAANIPIIKKQRWVLSTSLRYKLETLSFKNVTIPSGGSPIIPQKSNDNFHYFFGSVNYTRYDKLFGKPFISNLSVFGDASEEKLGVLNASYIGSFLLKKNERTSFTAGLIVQTNSNGIFPVMPIISYSHKFKNSPWEADIILPKQIYFRRLMSKNSRLSLGSVIDSNPFYFNSNFLGGENTYNYNKIEIKTGFLYEYRFHKHFISSFKSGWGVPLKGTIREKGRTKEIVKTNFDSNFYFNLGISYNLLK